MFKDQHLRMYVVRVTLNSGLGDKCHAKCHSCGVFLKANVCYMMQRIRSPGNAEEKQGLALWVSNPNSYQVSFVLHNHCVSLHWAKLQHRERQNKFDAAHWFDNVYMISSFMLLLRPELYKNFSIITSREVIETEFDGSSTKIGLLWYHIFTNEPAPTFGCWWCGWGCHIM